MIVAAVLAALAVTVPLAGSRAAAVTPGGRRRRPNILFVFADDLDLAEMRYLPHVRALLAAQGTTFDHYFVEQLAVLPVAHHDVAGSVRAQHRGVDQRW